MPYAVPKYSNAPESSASEKPESGDSARRSEIRAILDEPFEKAPQTVRSNQLEYEADYLLLAGRTIPYSGDMIPCKNGVINVAAGEGGLVLHLDFEANDGTRMKGYLKTDEQGRNAVITDSEVGLNNYFRYRYPDQAQQLADEILKPLKTAENSNDR